MVLSAFSGVEKCLETNISYKQLTKEFHLLFLVALDERSNQCNFEHSISSIVVLQTSFDRFNILLMLVSIENEDNNFCFITENEWFHCIYAKIFRENGNLFDNYIGTNSKKNVSTFS